MTKTYYFAIYSTQPFETVYLTQTVATFVVKVFTMYIHNYNYSDLQNVFYKI